MSDFEIDRARFGQFLAEERKGKGLTQKDLARRLFVSDKAVSKWERGLSLPDVSLLIPLARELGVTVTELLEGRRLDTASGMGMAQVERLVKKTLTLSADPPEEGKGKRGKRLALWGLCVAASLGEIMLVGILSSRLHFPMAHFFQGSSWVTVLLGAVFSAWAWLFARERIPAYYDENRIGFYSDGFFRMNVPGVSFNNSNWPHILRWLRWWSLGVMVGTPAAYTLAELLLGAEIGNLVMLVLFLGSLFLPLYLLGRKYQ